MSKTRDVLRAISMTLLNLLSREGPNQKITSALFNARTSEGLSLKSCGETVVRISNFGAPVPTMIALTMECSGLIVVTTLTSALAPEEKVSASSTNIKIILDLFRVTFSSQLSIVIL